MYMLAKLSFPLISNGATVNAMSQLPSGELEGYDVHPLSMFAVFVDVVVLFLVVVLLEEGV